jgi:hypothetical protein
VKISEFKKILLDCPFKYALRFSGMLQQICHCAAFGQPSGTVFRDHLKPGESSMNIKCIQDPLITNKVL